MLKNVLIFNVCALFLCTTLGAASVAHAHSNDSIGLSVAYTSRNGPATGYTEYEPTVSTTTGDVLLFIINITDRGATEHQSSNLKVKFSYRTNYPRVFMNTYHEANGPAAWDLSLATRDEHARHNTTAGLTWSGSSTLTVSWNQIIAGPIYLFVRVNDPAAYGVLTLQLRYHDEVHLPIPWDVDTATKTTPVNSIADVYDAKTGYAAARTAGNITDNETGPGINMNKGDGFSYWEEYRGVVVNGYNFRLNPTVKDIFVHSGFSSEYSSLGNPSFISEGYGYAENLKRISGSPNVFAVHLIRRAEQGTLSSRIVNFNTYAAYQVKLQNGNLNPFNQKAIHVVRDNRSVNQLQAYLSPAVRRQIISQHPDLALPENAGELETLVARISGSIYGRTLSEPGYPHESPNGPSAIRKVEIFTTSIRFAENTRPTEGAKITIGHEIGHAISLWHTTNTGSIMVGTGALALTPTVYHTLHNPEYNLYPQTEVTRPTRP